MICKIESEGHKPPSSPPYCVSRFIQIPLAFYECRNALIDIWASAFYGFYPAHDPAIHFPAGFFSKATCHFITVLADTKILLAHVIAVMNPEIIQE